MRKSVIGCLMVIVMLLTLCFGTAYAKNESKRQIIVFEDGVSAEKKTKILEKHKATKIKDIVGTNAVVVDAVEMSAIESEPEIRFIEDDLVISISGSSSKKDKATDDSAVEQPDEVVPWGVEYMNNLTSVEGCTGLSVKVGVVDTGIDIDHPDLVDNIKGGYNATSKKKSYDDDNGHGTHVAGIIAAVDNEIGVVGVAPEAEIYAVKALDSNGNGYISDVIEGIEWCIENNIDIINMSIGMTVDSVILHESVCSAYDVGILMVAAAGNNYGGRCEYPAAYNEVIGVGAIDINGEVTAFSAMDGVDAWAPGKDIYSSYLNATYKVLNGTSMAAPHYISKILKND